METLDWRYRLSISRLQQGRWPLGPPVHAFIERHLLLDNDSCALVNFSLGNCVLHKGYSVILWIHRDVIVTLHVRALDLSLQKTLANGNVQRTQYSLGYTAQKVLAMVETTTTKQLADRQTQFGNARQLEPSDCIFVFKGSQSDYEEPPSDGEEVSPLAQLYLHDKLVRLDEERNANAFH